MSAPSAQTPSPDREPGKADREPGKAGRRDSKEVSRGIAMLVLAGLFIAFAVLNVEEVHVDWILGSGRAPLILVIIISLLVGIVLTYFAERLRKRSR